MPAIEQFTKTLGHFSGDGNMAGGTKGAILINMPEIMAATIWLRVLYLMDPGTLLCESLNSSPDSTPKIVHKEVGKA